MLKRITQAEIINYIIKFIRINLIEIHEQVYITIIIKTVSKNRSEYRKLLNLVSTTQLDYCMQISLYKIHNYMYY